MSVSEQQTMDLELPKLSQGQMYKTLYNHIRDAYDGFISTLKPSTGKTYGWIVLKFLFSINNSNPLVLRQYNAIQWSKYAEDNLNGLSASTVALRVAAVKSFFGYLISKGERKTNPLEHYELPQANGTYNSRIILSWEQINELKLLQDDKLYGLFAAAYYHKKSITETGLIGSTVSYMVGKMGDIIGVSGLKYSDITESRKRYFANCPATGRELEMTEENWIFKDGLLQAKIKD